MAKKTISQTIRENSKIELLPERNMPTLQLAECKPFYLTWIFWLIILAFVGVVIYWKFFY